MCFNRPSRAANGLPWFFRSSSILSLGNMVAHPHGPLFLCAKDRKQKQPSDPPFGVTRNPETVVVAPDEEGRDGLVEDAGIEGLKSRGDGRGGRGRRHAGMSGFPFGRRGRGLRLSTRNLVAHELCSDHCESTDGDGARGSRRGRALRLGRSPPHPVADKCVKRCAQCGERRFEVSSNATVKKDI
jgi:hypothetical protein